MKKKVIKKKCDRKIDSWGIFVKLSATQSFLFRRINKNMSTAIMQTGAMGWDYKFPEWNDSNDVGDLQLKVRNINFFLLDQCVCVN